MTRETEVEAWFEKRNLTLDLAGLTDRQREAGSILIGGSAAHFVSPEDDFSYGEVVHVIFNWGDRRAEDVFAIMLEHDDKPEPFLFSFTPSTVIGDEIWSTALQDKDFDPVETYPSERYYYVLPFDAEMGLAALRAFISKPIPRPELLGRVGTRWLAFELGIKI